MSVTSFNSFHHKEVIRGLVPVAETVDGDNTAAQVVQPDPMVSYLTTDGSTTQNDFTLPDGEEAQRKTIHLKTKGSTENAVVTPANLHGGTTITFDAEKETAELQFLGGAWVVTGGNATVA